jgi:aconitate hydratase
MGAELGATTSVFPSDEETRRFLRAAGREEDWLALHSDDGASYDFHDEINLSRLVPLIALPPSPGNVVPVREVAGEEIYQAYVGSSANPGYRDFAIAALMLEGRHVDPRVSFDVNPTSRELLEILIAEGLLAHLVRGGARLHQAGCNGCIGMGQAPATGRNSLRTVPRNFPGRSGTKEDRVFLCSPETATASALRGAITDPRDLDMPCPHVKRPDIRKPDTKSLVAPLPPEDARKVELRKGPNIESLPRLGPLPDEMKLPILLRLGDGISTDEILPAGARVLPFRSNIRKISQFAFEPVDDSYVRRAVDAGAHAVVAGENYGQGSSREHAALATRFLGLRLVVAKSFARIHWQNLVNFGVLPVTFQDPRDYARLGCGGLLLASGLREALRSSETLALEDGGGEPISVRHALSSRQVDVVLAGGLIPWMRRKK